MWLKKQNTKQKLSLTQTFFTVTWHLLNQVSNQAFIYIHTGNLKKSHMLWNENMIRAKSKYEKLKE